MDTSIDVMNTDSQIAIWRYEKLRAGLAAGLEGVAIILNALEVGEKNAMGKYELYDHTVALLANMATAMKEGTEL